MPEESTGVLGKYLYGRYASIDNSGVREEEDGARLDCVKCGTGYRAPDNVPFEDVLTNSEKYCPKCNNPNSTPKPKKRKKRKRRKKS